MMPCKPYQANKTEKPEETWVAHGDLLSVRQSSSASNRAASWERSLSSKFAAFRSAEGSSTATVPMPQNYRICDGLSCDFRGGLAQTVALGQ